MDHSQNVPTFSTCKLRLVMQNIFRPQNELHAFGGNLEQQKYPLKKSLLGIAICFLLVGKVTYIYYNIYIYIL
jgi:hypothetical protein